MYKWMQVAPSSFQITKENAKRGEFSTLEEFFSTPYIRSWSRVEGFKRFRLDPSTEKNKYRLVCEYRIATKDKDINSFIAFVWTEE